MSRLRAAQSARPNPHPRPFSHWEKGGRRAGLRVRSLLPPEAITDASLMVRLPAGFRKSLIFREVLSE
jgi:hypothetical protein